MESITMHVGAVLPIKASGSYGADDLSRAHILFRSLQRFAPAGFFGEFWIVTPDDEVALVEKEYARWSEFNIRVVSELNIAPELNKYPKMRGWRKQQIIKLAIANHMASDYYLTFDADVICLKSFEYNSLFPDGKAILQYERCAQHPKWWRSSARILGTPAPPTMRQGMTVTPAILASDIARKVQSELMHAQRTDNWIDWLCQLHLPGHPKNWLPHRYLMNKWTEYSLYYLTARKTGLLDEYHVICASEAYPQRLLVHESHPFEQWQTQYSFSDQCPGLFCVVGSKSFLPPETVWNKVAPFIEESPQTL